jgi:hypothetical protein
MDSRPKRQRVRDLLDNSVLFPFPHRYEIELRPELPPCPGTQRVVYFPSERRLGQSPFLVRVLPEGGPSWIGVFALGEALHSPCVILSTPDERTVCVLAEGNGYIVRTDNPDQWQPVGCVPVFGAVPIVDAGLLVFTDYTRLVAHDRHGAVWTTRPLSWDGITITAAGREAIRGYGYDASNERDVEFVVDTATGAATGGSDPADPWQRERAGSAWTRFLSRIRRRRR